MADEIDWFGAAKAETPALPPDLELPAPPAMHERPDLPLSAFAAQAVDSFAKLPTWVRLDPETVTIDAAELIRSLGYGELLPYIKSLRVLTRAGRIVLEFSAASQ